MPDVGGAFFNLILAKVGVFLCCESWGSSIDLHLSFMLWILGSSIDLHLSFVLWILESSIDLHQYFVSWTLGSSIDLFFVLWILGSSIDLHPSFVLWIWGSSIDLYLRINLSSLSRATNIIVLSTFHKLCTFFFVTPCRNHLN